MKRILAYLKPYRGKIVLALVLVAISTVCNLLLPTFMSWILNRGIRDGDFPYIARCCGGMLLTAVVSLGTILWGTKLSTDVVSGFTADLRGDIFRHVQRLTFEEFSTLGAGALITRSTYDVGTVSWVASMLAGTAATIPALFLGGILLSFLKDPMLACVLLLFVPFILLLVIRIGKKVVPLWTVSDTYIDRQNDIMRERLRGIRVIRAFRSEEKEHRRIEDATHIMAENIIRGNVAMGLISPVATLALNLAIVLVVYLGGLRIGAGTLQAGDLYAVIEYITLVMSGVTMAAFAIVMYPRAVVAAGRIGEVFDAGGTEEPLPDDGRVFRGKITLRHATFRYQGASNPAVNDVSLEILPGQKVSIIGGTGSGKSSLVSLLLGFRSPTEGEVLFDDVPASSLSRRTLRRNISSVLQNGAIYAGTIRENILMGKPDATEQELREALEIAQMTEFVDEYPDGADHVLEQSGRNLSGGQKQRLSIARAILKDAPIYLFDDSFSALDFLTEARLRTALSEKIRGKTQIVITQRVTSAMSSDCIFVMDNGSLADCGTHEELLSRCRIYREIYASQTGGVIA